MADCVSPPNAVELVVELRAWSGCIIYGDNCDECGKEEGQERRFCRQQQETMYIAADAIEQLAKENAKLKAERDAAINDIPRFCDKCKHLNQTCCVGCEWEWRGVQNA